MNKYLLNGFIAIAKFFLPKDVDIEKLRTIVETKAMAFNRQKLINANLNKAKPSSNNALIFAYIMYAFMSLLITGVLHVAVKGQNSVYAGSIILNGYLLFMMAMTLVTDFSQILLDTTDNQIIFSKPVNSSTYFSSKLVFILMYILQYTFAFAIVPVVYLFVVKGFLVGIVSLIMVLLTVMLTVFLTYFLYGFMLKFSSEQKLKSVVNGFQIVITILFAVGFQIVPRLLDFSSLSITLTPKIWHYFFSPAWMAATTEIANGIYSTQLFIMAALSIIVPFVSLYYLVKFIAPYFSRKIELLAGETSKVAVDTNFEKSKPLAEKFANAFCKNNQEKAGFDLAWHISSRDKGFKLQFYPSVFYCLTIVAVSIFKNGKSFERIWSDLPNTNHFLWFAYSPLFIGFTLFGIMNFYENFSAAWVYTARPIEKPGIVIGGAIKALFVKYFTPVFLVFFVIAYSIWGLKIADDFLLAFAGTCFLLLVNVLLSKIYMPFSVQITMAQQSGKFIMVMLRMLLMGVVCLIHYVAIRMNQLWLVPALGIVLIFATYFMLQKIKLINWDKIIL
jgi:ABC-2 type transport system permease protein